MLGMTGVCAVVSVGVLFLILGYLLYNGGTSVNWDFFTKLPKPVGESGGGMANAIVGSAKLLLRRHSLACLSGFLAESTSRNSAGALRLRSYVTQRTC